MFYNESYCYISLFFLIKNSNIIVGNNILKFNTFLQIFIDWSQLIFQLNNHCFVFPKFQFFIYLFFHWNSLNFNVYFNVYLLNCISCFYNLFIVLDTSLYLIEKAVVLLFIFIDFPFLCFMENKFVLDPYFGDTTDPDSLINYIYAYI